MTKHIIWTEMDNDPGKCPLPPVISDAKFRAFITGSHVYGRPGQKADLDAVPFVSREMKKFLKSLCDSPLEENLRGYGSPHIRFGNLQLICCVTENQYKAWFETTRKLIKIKPVTRDFAVEQFKAAFEKYGCYKNQDDIG